MAISADIKGVLDNWPIDGPWRLRPAGAGTNNRSFFVDAPSRSYFLRIYLNTADPSRARYEHRLLLRLQQAPLSFSVPCPLVTRSGETFVVLPNGAETIVATLSPVIPGSHPEPGNRSQAFISGAALGELDAALAEIPVDTGWRPHATYLDLDQIHPLVPDPLDAVARPPIAGDQRTDVRQLLVDLLDAVPSLYASLPRQVIHADFARSNTLIVGDRVTGILDFEFACPDLRAMDPVTGLFSFSGGAWGTRRGWTVLEAFAAGYASRIGLTDDEVKALPTLLRLRDAASLIHRIGRYRQGVEADAAVVDRARDVLFLDEWLRTHGDELIRRLAAARR